MLLPAFFNIKDSTLALYAQIPPPPPPPPPPPSISLSMMNPHGPIPSGEIVLHAH
ncbi:hypothetical protein OH492_12970 [Vibrio chagasii]|nr:hypothetical protein [Vibrio chagasii]